MYQERRRRRWETEEESVKVEGSEKEEVKKMMMKEEKKKRWRGRKMGLGKRSSQRKGASVPLLVFSPSLPPSPQPVIVDVNS